jgi:hypothetical protein
VTTVMECLMRYVKRILTEEPMYDVLTKRREIHLAGPRGVAQVQIAVPHA